MDLFDGDILRKYYLFFLDADWEINSKQMLFNNLCNN